MPGKLVGTGKRKVKVTWGGRTVARSTSRAKGKRQLNLLRGIKRGWRPTGAKARDLRHKTTRSGHR